MQLSTYENIAKTISSAALAPDVPTPECLSDAKGNPEGRRFSVYRNNVAVSLKEALKTRFTFIFRLLGEVNFNTIAGEFIEDRSPDSPLMMFYGAAFPSFVSNCAQLDHLAYISDVARLELALRSAYHAADSTPIYPSALEAFAPNKLSKAYIELAPAVRLISSPWPIHAI